MKPPIGFDIFKPWWRAFRSASPPAPPAPSCAATYTGAIGPAFGYAAADVTGQTISVTEGAANVYLASTPFATAGERRAMPAAGKKVWLQVDSMSAFGGAGANCRGGFAAFDGAGNLTGVVVCRGASSGVSTIYVESSPGVLLGTFLLPQGAVPYLLLAAGEDGELYFRRNDTGSIVAASSIEPALAGVFSTAATIIALGMLDLSGGGGATASVRVVTDQNTFVTRAGLTGDEDWCGNTIA